MAARWGDEVQRLNVLLEDATRRALLPCGLTPTQFQLLRLLDQAPREGMSISTLAQRLLCTRGNASRLVARMVDAGLVTTGSVHSDERLVLVRPTSSGRQRLVQAGDLVDRGGAQWTPGLPEAEADQLATRLGALADELHRYLNPR